MAAKEDYENASQEGDQRLFTKERSKGKWGFGKGQSWNEKGGKGDKDGGKNSCQKGSGKTRNKGQEKGGKGEKPEHVGRVARQDTLQPGARKEATNICTPSMKMTEKTSKNQMTTKLFCKHGICWKRVRMSSGKK